MTALDMDALIASVRAEVARYPEIAAAWIFGSMARGEAHEGSDLDVALSLLPSSARDEHKLLTLAAALERHSPSGKIDLVVLGKQGPVFRHRVLKEGKLLYDAQPELRIAFEARTISEYLDWKPTHEIAMRATFEGLRERFARGAR